MMCTIDKPNKQVTGRPEATVFIARLNHITNEGTVLQLSWKAYYVCSADTLCEAFSKYGKIVHCRIVRDIGKGIIIISEKFINDLVTCRSKGYAFIEFKHRSDAEDAEQVSILYC